MKLVLFTFSFNNQIRNALEIARHRVREFSVFAKNSEIIRIDQIKMSLIVSFINQTGKPMFIALKFDKYYK